MKPTLTIILLFFSGTFSSTAQNTISGKITDETKTSLPFANVILYEKGSTENPKGVISDDNGNYHFENIKNGNYYIVISMLGFETKKNEPFLVATNQIFNFILKEETQTLKEVVIKSKRPVIRQTAEKLIVDLEKSEMINTSLQDVMRKIPGVLVTNNGISIAGNRGVRILINGKTTEYMDVETLLRDFPANNISKIEVIELSKELQFAENYIFLINTRFSSNYKFTIMKNINIANKFIPTGAIQALLENVVKHNKSEDKTPIKTTITINDAWLILTNTKSNTASNQESFGTGLENLKARYKLLSDQQIQIHNMDKKFEVFIPIITLSE